MRLWRVRACLGLLVGFAALMASLEARQAGAPLAPALQVTSNLGSVVSLQWIPNAGGPAPTAFQLQAGSGPGLADLAVVNLPNQTVFTASAPPGTYYVRLIAINAAGASAASNELIVNVGPSGCVPPATPAGLTSSVSGNIVTLSWNTPAGGGAPTSHILYVGSTVGVIDIGTFVVGPATTFSSPAPAGQYFVRVAASNACGNSASTLPTSLIIGGGALTWPAGTYDGLLFNHSKPGFPPITSFTLQLNQAVPTSAAFQMISAVWMDNRGCVRTTNIFAGTFAPPSGPTVSIESLACNDGDLTMRLTSVSGNVYSGVCPNGGSGCTFQMTRR